MRERLPRSGHSARDTPALTARSPANHQAISHNIYVESLVPTHVSLAEWIQWAMFSWCLQSPLTLIISLLPLQGSLSSKGRDLVETSNLDSVCIMYGWGSLNALSSSARGFTDLQIYSLQSNYPNNGQLYCSVPQG